MVRPDTTSRLVALLVVAIWATPACEALFYDLDAVPVQASDTTSPADTAPLLSDGEQTARDVETGPSDAAIPRDSDTATPDTRPADTRAAPDPTSSCLAVASCGYLRCPDLTDQCLLRATGHGDRSVRGSAKDVLECSRNNDCDFFFRPPCVEQRCSTTFETCLAEKPYGGDLSCFEIVNCRRQCSEGSLNCPSECISSGSSRGRRRFGALKSCIDDKCQGAGPGKEDECLRSECADEFEKCMGCP
ncbi:MAG: hypothetical protein ABEN55_21805 [Bradymonadaceae bacterium]